MSSDFLQSAADEDGPAWSGLLLAGGQSQRMGSDKALLSYKGEPLWRHQWKTLLVSGASETLIARGQWPAEEMIRAGLQPVRDVDGVEGPLAGLLAGLRVARHSWMAVLAIDLPLVPPAYLRRLISIAMETNQGVVPVRSGRAEPLAAVYPRECLVEAEAALGSERWSLQHLVAAWVEVGKVRSVSPGDHEKRYFSNLNTPADLAALSWLSPEESTP